MMDKHVHEWEYSNILGYFGCTNEICENTMRLKEAESRLNATERLLRKAFRNGRVWSDVLIVQDALRAFHADILDGK